MGSASSPDAGMDVVDTVQNDVEPAQDNSPFVALVRVAPFHDIAM